MKDMRSTGDSRSSAGNKIFCFPSNLEPYTLNLSFVTNRYRVCLWITALFLILTLPSLAWPKEPPVESLLPSPGFSGEWRLDGQIKTYSQDDLFTYIDGEAELYFPYGFERLATAFYTKEGGDPQIGLAADIYQMGSLLDAFGIYSQYRKPDAEFIPMGGEGFVNPSQLLFYQDRFFVQLSASGTAQLDRSVFESCARAISRALPGPPKKPLELNLLKIPALIPQTERYFPESLLGYSFFRRGLIALASQNGKKFRIFVIIEDSAQSAKIVLDRYVRYLKDSKVPSDRILHLKDGGLFAPDPLHKGLMLTQKGRFIAGAADLENPAQGSTLIEQIMTRLP
jgi:Family of unknown function (DUF6599)